ncbi:MAG: LuxR C-terminal-related transcriptional regulator [Saprospiraceae bacterium]|nr:LuxR C-terminal-related transcriptional regulator [Saprospiraceae bacterium]
MQDNLTPRERQILLLLSRDLTSKELARSLYISFETVKSHRQRLLRKLDVKTTGGLVRRGFELGLLKL